MSACASSILNHDDVRTVTLGSRFTDLTELQLPVELLQADLVVSMPKLKTHHWAGMTGSMKNLFGVVPGAVYGWPKNILHWRGIDNSIVDLVSTIRPGLAIVDGIVGMEGDGPIMGTARPVGCVVMGQDPVAVDATCARVMGLRPERINFPPDGGGVPGQRRRPGVSSSEASGWSDFGRRFRSCHSLRLSSPDVV